LRQLVDQGRLHLLPRPAVVEEGDEAEAGVAARRQRGQLRVLILETPVVALPREEDDRLGGRADRVAAIAGGVDPFELGGDAVERPQALRVLEVGVEGVGAKPAQGLPAGNRGARLRQPRGVGRARRHRAHGLRLAAERRLRDV
jgi:hypothetical protein